MPPPSTRKSAPDRQLVGWLVMPAAAAAPALALRASGATPAALDKAILEELCARKGVSVEPISTERSAAMQAKQRFGFEPYVIHDLRRSTGTNLGALDVPPVVIEACLGHESGAAKGGKIAAIYNRHQYLKQKGEALAAWADHICQQTGANVTPMRRAA